MIRKISNMILHFFCEFLAGFVLGCIETDYSNYIIHMRFSAFFKIYMICTLVHRFKFNILSKKLFNKSGILVKFRQIVCNFFPKDVSLGE